MEAETHHETNTTVNSTLHFFFIITVHFIKNMYKYTPIMCTDLYNFLKSFYFDIFISSFLKSYNKIG